MSYKLNPFTGNFDDTLSASEIQATGFPRIIKGTVATAAATVAKEVTIAGYTLTAGDMFCITYTLGNTVGSPTLSVNGGDAISIYLGSTAASTTTHTVGANGEILYYYDGTNFQMFGSHRTADSDTTYAVYHNATKVAGVDITRYKIVMEGIDGKFYPLSIGDTTALTKTTSAQKFKLYGLILWYGTTATVTADSTFVVTYTEYSTTSINYTVNQAKGFTNYAPLYLVGTVDANGDFQLDQTSTTSWFTQTLPSTADGKVYIRLGFNYATTGTIHLETLHPIYEYKNGLLRLYIPDNGSFLKLDQTTPQTVTDGMPSFEGGIKVPINGFSSFFGSNSPVVYLGNNCYVAPDPEDPEDGGLGAVWYVQENMIMFGDDGVVTPAELLDMTGATTPTINLHITGVNFGSEEEPYWIYLTGYSDLNLANFTAWEDTTFGLGGALVGVYTEAAFTYNAGTDTYTKVATLSVCPPSTNTTWTSPMVVTKLAGGFTVDPDTSDIRHNGDFTHLGNYTCNDETKVLRHKGSIKAGEGPYADLITCPIVSNPVFDVAGGGGLQFAMTFVPEVVRTGGTVGSPTYASIYVAGMYGTTVIEGSYTNFSGSALGGWCAIQNAIQGEGVKLSEGVAMRAGMTYASEYNIVVNALSCFQTGFTNLNNGTSTHTTVKHFETGNLTDKATAVTNYGLYIMDNSSHATTSWGVYSLEANNYAKKLYIGATPTTPTEDLEVQANVKAAGYKSGTETGQTTTVTVVTDTRMNSGQLEKKTQLLTYTAGLLTAKGAESEWTATTDI